MKRTWISVKRGLLEPKHREKLGAAVWLYLYILDRADWEQGAVLEWTDAGAADELQMDINTLRNHRRRLEEQGYITTQKKQHSQKLFVNNWTNPREYSGRVHNPRQSAKATTPSPEIQSGIQSGNQSGNQPIERFTTLTSNSKIKHQTSVKDSDTVYEPIINNGETEYDPQKHKPKPTQKQKKAERDALLDHPAIKAYRSIAHLQVDVTWRPKVANAVGHEPVRVEAWGKHIEDWIGRGWKKTNIKGMVESFQNGGIQAKQQSSPHDRLAGRLERLGDGVTN